MISNLSTKNSHEKALFGHQQITLFFFHYSKESYNLESKHSFLHIEIVIFAKMLNSLPYHGFYRRSFSQEI